MKFLLTIILFAAFRIHAASDITIWNSPVDWYNGVPASLRITNKTLVLCEIDECGTAGVRKLLVFDVGLANMGPDNFFLAASNRPDLFFFDDCHGHYHLTNFYQFRLRDQSESIIQLGKKMGFCLLNQIQVSGTNPPPAQVIDCSAMDLGVGWMDVYSSFAQCQFIDMTGISNGNYQLEVEVDPNKTYQIGPNVWPDLVRVPFSITNDNLTLIGVLPTAPAAPSHLTLVRNKKTVTLQWRNESTVTATNEIWRLDRQAWSRRASLPGSSTQGTDSYVSRPPTAYKIRASNKYGFKETQPVLLQ